MTDDFYASQSTVTDPGALAAWTATAGPTIEDIQRASSRFVFHYRGGGDFAENGVPLERIDEIDLRYADEMLSRLRARNGDIAADRKPAERVVGCCRDFTVLFLALARQRGIPARARVGFAGYFMPGWWLDHVIAEVLIDGAWRLVEPQIDRGYVDPADGVEVNVYDVPREKFLVGPEAWVTARDGVIDPEKFVVQPEPTEPFLRSWNYLAHNLILDLASLNKDEAILWDIWGLNEILEPPTEAARDKLDRVAHVLRDRDVSRASVAAAYDDPDVRMPEVIRSVSPVTLELRTVAVRQ